MALTAHRFVGLDRDVWLPDDIQVETRIIEHPRFRSFTAFSGQTRTTWHDTGATGSNAEGEWRWANDGRPGADPGGYNFFVDDRRIIQAAPLNEVTWHAGGPEGNRMSWGAEQCFVGVNWDRSFRNMAALHGGLSAAMGWEVDTHLVQHNYWERADGTHKDCPGEIRHRGLWSQAIRLASDAAAAARAAAGPEDGLTAVYAEPSPVPALDAIRGGDRIAPAIVHDAQGGVDYIWVGDRVRCLSRTPRNRFAVKDGQVIGPSIQPGEELDVDYLFATAEGWWYITPNATRVIADDVVRISEIRAAA